MALMDLLPASVSSKVKAPTQWIKQYNTFILANQPSISTIETSLRSLTYLIPHRYSDANLVSESIQAGSNLLSLYHTSVLDQDRSTQDKARGGGTVAVGAFTQSPLARHTAAVQPKLSAHNRYTAAWTHKSGLYNRLATGLQVIQYTELLVEMAARRKGQKVQRRVVFLIELLKAILRILLFKLTGDRPVVWPPRAERQLVLVPQEQESTLEAPEPVFSTESEWHDANEDVSVISVGGNEDADAKKNGSPTASASSSTYIGRRSGIVLDPLPGPEVDIHDYLSSRMPSSPDALTVPTSLFTPLRTTPGIVSEYMYILRPLVYLALSQYMTSHQTLPYTSSTSSSSATPQSRLSTLLRSRAGRWSPWLLGLAMEYASRQLVKVEFGRRGSSRAEQEEVRRRGFNMVWWGMRGAAWEEVTKEGIVGLADWFETKPVVGGIIGGALREYSALWGGYHFATSTL